MRNNQPTTQIETVIPEGAFIYSRTDLKGRITEANEAFAEISGYTQKEMIGEPHNLIRHPDMPTEAFADMWACLKQGLPWKGVVKNRRKDGGFYWVVANVSPVRENGQIVGYQSVRTRPTSAQISAADQAYRRLHQGTQSIRIQNGRVVAKHSPFVDWAISHQTRLNGFAALALVIGLCELLAAVADLRLSRQVEIAASILLVASSAYMLFIYLVTAFRRLGNVLNFLDQTLTTGDLRTTLTPTKNDLIGAIANRVDILASSMRATLQIVEAATHEVAKTTTGLNQSVEQQTAAAATQSATTSEAAAGMEEMTVSIGTVAEHAADTLAVVRQTGQTAQQGADLSVRATETIRALSSTVARSAETVEQLGKRTEEIGKIAAVIKEIADQTNLLALNAAIEAARAGEQGRGFSVVADEVRKLAERTAGATREIGQMITQIQGDTESAVGSMRESASQMDDSVLLVNDAHQALMTINTEMSNTVQRVTDIYHSSSEQNTAMGSLAKGVECIANLTEENLNTAKITEKSSHAVQTNVARMLKAVTLYRT